MPVLRGRGRRCPARRDVARRFVRLAVPALITSVVILASGLARGASDTKRTLEYDLKAAFLFNFTEFVEWPASAFADSTSPFVIGVLGHDPFGGSLDEIVANESVSGHRVVVTRFRDAADVTSCHILFVPSSGTPPPRALASLTERGVLTVGETDAFGEAGGAIRFFLVENRLRLRINVAAVTRANLTISSMLLRQADLVEEARPE